jgi:metallo-beta-lactamase class B
MKLRLLACATLFIAVTSTVYAQVPAPVTPEALVTAAKRAAGADHAGTFLRICVAPDNLNAGGPRGGGPGPRAVPDRATWYAKPYKVFDNLYFIGTRIHSAWALTTSDGIIVIDTLFDYAIEPEMVEGMTALGLDPRTIKYVLISHAHGDHDQGAALLQRRGAKVVMGAADWEATLQRPATAPGGVPTRDIAVGPEGLKLRLGDTLVDVIATPGHTPGTLSYVFPVKDRGRSLVVAYSGGTAFNFPRRPENFAVYRDTQRKMIEIAGAAGATVLMTNHTEFDRAYDRARLAQLPRAAGEKHPYETDAATVQRYFEMARDCAEAQRLSIK